MGQLSNCVLVSIICLAYMFLTIDKYNFCSNILQNQAILNNPSFRIYKKDAINNCNLIKKVVILNNSFDDTEEVIEALNEYSFYKFVINVYYYFLRPFNANQTRTLKPSYIVGFKVNVQFKILRFVHLILYFSTMFVLFTYLPKLISSIIEKTMNIVFYCLFLWIILDLVFFEIGSSYSMNDFARYVVKYFYNN